MFTIVVLDTHGITHGDLAEEFMLQHSVAGVLTGHGHEDRAYLTTIQDLFTDLVMEVVLGRTDHNVA